MNRRKGESQAGRVMCGLAGALSSEALFWRKICGPLWRNAVGRGLQRHRLGESMGEGFQARHAALGTVEAE